MARCCARAARISPSSRRTSRPTTTAAARTGTRRTRIRATGRRVENVIDATFAFATRPHRAPRRPLRPLALAAGMALGAKGAAARLAARRCKARCARRRRRALAGGLARERTRRRDAICRRRGTRIDARFRRRSRRSRTISAPRIGVLLVNLGTPDAPTPAAVRRYLARVPGRPARRRNPALPLEADPARSSILRVAAAHRRRNTR